jgi:Xaa-Pro aminopeptidase
MRIVTANGELKERQKRVLEAIGQGVMILPSAPLAIRNNDVEHEYRQDSDLYYLTGFDEPESALVMRGGHADPVVMFVRPRDPEREVWDGQRAGVEGAVQSFGANVAYSTHELSQKLPELLENVTRLYYRIGRDRAFDELVLGAIDRVRARAKFGVAWPVEIVDPSTVVHEMRVIKSKEELDAMRRAVDITREAHVAAMGMARPGVYEYEVEAVLRSIFRKHGSERPAYGPIVGSGPNATVLHYRRNDRKLEDGDLLLIDAGCEYGYYASDITRTFPVNGHFTKEQKEIYEIVLSAQLASIDASRPGRTLEEVHDASVQVIAKGLLALGLIEGPLETALEKQIYKKFFMHRTSHWLGMDVHDVGRYFQSGKARPLTSGMVITVEPGIYIAENESSVPAAYRGIGVRIEDDVLIGPEGPTVLSSAIPKTIEEVERASA